MARRGKVVKNDQRAVVVARHSARRAELKELVRTGSEDERREAQRLLQRLPRDASPVRLRNRDQVDGRPRGFVRKAGLSRIRFRQAAHAGELPGITKSSW
ncbi:30S ribosomal protein S14 [Aeromicrobium sp. Root495]|uniref:30S ribosomal protein S14 n=1 Tax=Aeromicrobium sp. Root495 TaxID=1736550 RepID=UPI0006FF5579|nr:30S ribosomal protein S14 [Aeromicrobium sp. Root495]KQY60379.1 30S ribosomal protein S14 [Aeromicrobium sp. Root495]RYJ07348.1 MAG: 30S ribosomal protein S14 [Actinomycetales bacterium]